MTQSEFLQKHSHLLDKVKELTAKKNSDYSNEDDAFFNFRLVEKLGITSTETGMLVRITDKFARTLNLLKNAAKVEDESIIDTLIDWGNYCFILALFLSEKEDTNGKKKNQSSF